MMVNRLGLTVRGLQAYHMGQNQPLPDVKHESAKDMKQPEDWRLCELGKVGKILDELLVGVKKENKGNEDLEAMYDAANKGFIKRSYIIPCFLYTIFVDLDSGYQGRRNQEITQRS